ncbi:MAG: hypothetical protein K8F91_23140 [Candidatus Obscuribacterales bacterium]|nr:hypothetical protein [Candidatus Obscuribacterales bacterium]
MENIYAAENRQRLMDELQTTIKTATRQPAAISEDIETLHELFEQAVGINKPEPEPSLDTLRPIPKMTYQDLKSMKQASKKTTTARSKLITRLGMILIRAINTIGSWFSTPQNSRPLCKSNGHQCLHCGATIKSS